ncbi:MAG TPA: protein kinase [Steroidobacteraceae bacterium]|nr:protein kinase [Steroidobacteraceae bacterium]
MDEPRTRRFLIVEDDSKYAAWIQHAMGAGFPNDSLVIMDWASFARVRTAMTVRDYDIVMLAMAFDEGIEEPTTDSLDWVRKLRSQPGFPEMIILAEGGSELAAVRTLRLGAADYLPKRLLTPPRLHRSIKLTLRAIEKEMARRAARNAPVPADPATATVTAAKVEPAAVAPAAAPATAPVTASATAPAPVAPSVPAAAPMPAPTPAATEKLSPVVTHTGTNLAKIAAQVVKAPVSPVSPVATHTGASLAAAAKAAIATHGGSNLAAAAKAALAPVKIGLVRSEPPKADAAPRDPAAVSLPGVSATGGSAPVPQAKESNQVAPPHHQIPGYTILQRIGESEAAAVYLAISEDAGQNVALKVSKRKHSGSDPNDTGQRSIMFQREFEAIAALDHPSIIDLHDYGIHEGVEYLAMEYFPCGDLKARLQNPLTADEAITFVKEIARSLKVVHDAGIIHRDLKPPNVMLRDDGSVVLIDFGLARSLLGGDGSTRTGVLRGSPYYMSPEQAQGEVLDARTDIYSLGVILYEMLAGKKPYLGASAIDVLQQHVMAPVPELPVHHLFYQPMLERLMSKSREQRIATCDELLSALDQMAQALNDVDIIDPETLVTASVTS